MKKLYESPIAKHVSFETEDVLDLSGGNNPILDSKDGNSNPDDSAKDFGSVDIF